MILFQEKIDAIAKADEAQVEKLLNEAQRRQDDINNIPELVNLFDTFGYCYKSDNSKIRNCIQEFKKNYNNITFNVDIYCSNPVIDVLVDCKVCDDKNVEQTVQLNLKINKYSITYLANTGWSMNSEKLPDIFTSKTVKYDTAYKKYFIDAFVDYASECCDAIKIPVDTLWILYDDLKNILPEYAKYACNALEEAIDNVNV